MESIAHWFVNLPIFALTWGTFFAAGIISFLTIARFNRQGLSISAFILHCFPVDLWKSKSAQTDVKVYVIRKLTDRFLGGTALLFTALAAYFLLRHLEALQPDHAMVAVSYPAIVGCSAALFLASEFADYVTHYIQHKIPFFWELHKVHHSALFLNPLTALRGHPVAYVLERATSGIVCGIPMGLFAFRYGLKLPDMLFLGACAGRLGTVLTLDVLKHSHFPVNFGRLDKILISPHMHQVHHSSLEHHWDRNYGTNLSIFDWTFGTAYQPRPGERIVYGLGKPEERDYDTLLGVYAGPLAKMWRLILPGGRQPDTYPTKTDAA